MYKLTMVLNGIYRHKRRNIISCLLLITVLSVTFCGFFYKSFAEEQKESVAERYENRYRVAFRNELQFAPDHPSRSALDTRLNGTSQTDGVPDVYFDADAMEAYNHPYPATAEMFASLGAAAECRDYSLAYAETAYGFSGDVPERIQNMLDAIYSMQEDSGVPTKIMTEHIVVGGDLSAFCGVARDITSGNLYDFILTAGEEPKKGECVITDFYAAVYGKDVGDRITLCDIYGKPVTELTISGIYSVYRTGIYEFVNPKVTQSGKRLTGTDVFEDYSGAPDVGTPFDRLCEDTDAQAYMLEHYRSYWRVSGAMLGVIHTDLETAYNLYGTAETDTIFNTRHHINNFFAYYNLVGGAQTAFEEEIHRILPQSYSAEVTVYPFSNSYETFMRLPESLLATANVLLQISVILTALLFCIVTAVLVHENGREIGIYLSLGISEKDIRMKTAGENAILMTVSLILAAICSIFVHRYLAKGYTYLDIYEVRYSMTGAGAVFAICAVVLSFLVTALYIAVYIRAHSPIRLIRQDET